MHDPTQDKGSEEAKDESPTPAEQPAVENPQTLADLQNAERQADYRKAYLEQLRRMSCPGCGEDPTLPF